MVVIVMAPFYDGSFLQQRILVAVYGRALFMAAYHAHLVSAQDTVQHTVQYSTIRPFREFQISYYLTDSNIGVTRHVGRRN